MGRAFMRGYLEESPETIERFKGYLQHTPSQEPANGGPADAEFFDALGMVARSIAASSSTDPFPDPLLTAQQRYGTKG